MSQKKPRKKNHLPFVIIGGVLAAAVGAILWLTRSPETGGANRNSAPSASASPSAPSPFRAAAPGAQPARVRGQESAPVTLEEFGDFQCPPCGNLHPQLKRVEEHYGPRLKVIFRHLPLSEIHKNAVAAARAAEAAGRQDRFWQMHDMLYERQDEWKHDADATERFVGYARTLGLNAEQFRLDMSAPAVAERVVADLARARSLGITGTPTVLLNGRELEFSAATYSYDGLRKLIDAELAKNKQ